MPQLQAWLTAHGADVTVLNAGVSGDTTAGGLSRIGWTLAGGGDAIIVELGGNDLLRGIDPAASRANLDGILNAATAKGLPVLLIGVKAPANYGPDYQQPLRRDVSRRWRGNTAQCWCPTSSPRSTRCPTAAGRWPTTCRATASTPAPPG